jgi:hypothetical protein
MTKAICRAIRFALLAGVATAATAQTSDTQYHLRPQSDGAVAVAREGGISTYRPVFTVIRTDSDPNLRLSGFSSTPGEVKSDAGPAHNTRIPANPENYPLPNWSRPDGSGATDNVYQAGAVTELRASASRALPMGGVAWTFPDNPDFTLTAEMRPVANAAPKISWRLTAKRPGWYTVGYTGGPATDPATADNVLQPLIWQEKRFPRAPLTTGEHMGGLPATLVTKGGMTNGLSVDPAESPFRLPVFSNARFGVMLRNPAGEAQPSAFAPLLGGAGSRLEAGQSTSFAVRPLLVKGDWYAAFTEAARDLFKFRDVRENYEQPLNATIDTMTEFQMDDGYSGWNADLRGFDYETDVHGTVKVVSALHPLSAAIIQDDPEIYRRRALPITEFLMSRTKYLYNTDPDVAGQNAARDMKGPAAEVSELAELYQMSREQTPVFLHYAKTLAGKPRQLNLKMTSTGENFWDKLAFYRLTGDKAQLDQARKLADAYIAERIDTPQTDFSDVHLDAGGQFWSDFSPHWIMLFELWQETGEPRYLHAAAAGARTYASYAWFYPAIPTGNVTVDEQGAPVGYHKSKLDAKPIKTPPVTLPAWQVSQVGLIPEAQTTYHLNPAVFLAHHAAYQLRIAQATQDPFLHDVARAAIVGRYKTYPGYDINVRYSSLHARSDFPLRPFHELNYNEVYYNHVWPHIALLIDYLVSDFETRSKGAIKFPARYAQGYAYLRSKVYGDRPGSFMGDRGVRLWMPRHLVRTDDPQANYLTGYGNDRLYLALTNESAIARTVTASFDRERVPWVPGRTYTARLWRDGKPAGSVTVKDGKVALPLSARGLTAIAIEGMPVFRKLQDDYFDAPAAPAGAAGERSYRTDHTPAGDATAMMLSFAGRHDFYLWTSASDADVSEVRARIRTASGERTLVDRRHPFEFSLPAQDDRQVSYRVEFVRKDGRTVATEEQSVER